MQREGGKNEGSKEGMHRLWEEEEKEGEKEEEEEGGGRQHKQMVLLVLSLQCGNTEVGIYHS